MTRFVCAVLAVALSISFAAADWPLYRGNPLMSGVAPANPVPFPAHLGEKWSFKTGDSIEAAPAVVKGVVYVGSYDKHFYAIDLATGKQKWKVKLGPIKASASVRGDRVYVGNIDGTFYCLDPAGKKLWEVKTDGPVNGSPAVLGDTTFVAGCDSIMHVLDARTGKELGAVDLGGQAAATAAVNGDAAYVGTMASTLVGVDLKARKKLWTFEPARRAQPFYASAVATNSLVIAGSRDQKVYALDRNTGKEVWSFATEGMVDGSPVVVGDRVYAGCLSRDGNFYVLDLKTGKKLQELELESAVTGSVAVGPDCLLVGTEKGVLYCLGAK